MTKEKSIDEIMAELANQQCWYPFTNCDTKAETTPKDPIGSDPMQYCKNHYTEMLQRYATEPNGGK